MRNVAIALLITSSGCMAGMHGALQDSSVGHVPCQKKEVGIDLDDYETGNGAWLWVAQCRGERYSCSRTFTGTAWTGGVSSETKCIKLETQSAAASACQKDCLDLLRPGDVRDACLARCEAKKEVSQLSESNR